ncbi:MAG: hypothetical protein OHK0056_31230 [Bacteriovoracaceae bacterium]
MKIFYRSEQNAKTNKSFSPSAGKPKLFVERAMDLFGDKIEVVDDFEPCTIFEIAKAHDQDFVIDVLNGKRQNGFGNTISEVNSTLPYTSASMRAALLYAFQYQTIACSPTSGFHHAGYKSARAFCTFNGLMVAAMELLDRYPNTRIGIFDLDMHYGDGTDEIIQWHDLHKKIKHYTLGREHLRKQDVSSWMENYAELVRVFLKEVDVVLFQAGADPHVNDPLGGLFTTEELHELHDTFFIEALERKIGVAWNLAGGYQQNIDDVLEIHMNTVSSAIDNMSMYPGITSQFDDLDEIIDMTEKLSESEFLDYLKLTPGIDEVDVTDDGHEVFLSGADVSFFTRNDDRYRVLEIKDEKSGKRTGVIIKTNGNGMMMIKEDQVLFRVEYFDERFNYPYNFDVDFEYILDEYNSIRNSIHECTDQHLYRRVRNFFVICQSTSKTGVDMYEEFRHLMGLLLENKRIEVFSEIQDHVDRVCMDHMNGCSG